MAEDNKQAAVDPPEAGLTRCIDVRHLLGSDRKLMLAHDGEIYWLRITAKGKLILTK